MATAPQQQPLKVTYVDLPEKTETFADSVHSMVWDGQILRIEFCATRFPTDRTGATDAKRYPAARLVLTATAATELYNRLQQTMQALTKAGVVASSTPPAKP